MIEDSLCPDCGSYSTCPIDSNGDHSPGSNIWECFGCWCKWRELDWGDKKIISRCGKVTPDIIAENIILYFEK